MEQAEATVRGGAAEIQGGPVTRGAERRSGPSSVAGSAWGTAGAAERQVTQGAGGVNRASSVDGGGSLGVLRGQQGTAWSTAHAYSPVAEAALPREHASLSGNSPRPEATMPAPGSHPALVTTSGCRSVVLGEQETLARENVPEGLDILHSTTSFSSLAFGSPSVLPTPATSRVFGPPSVLPPPATSSLGLLSSVAATTALGRGVTTARLALEVGIDAAASSSSYPSSMGHTVSSAWGVEETGTPAGRPEPYSTALPLAARQQSVSYSGAPADKPALDTGAETRGQDDFAADFHESSTSHPQTSI